MTRPLRIVQWTTSNIARQAVRAILDARHRHARALRTDRMIADVAAHGTLRLLVVAMLATGEQ